jgi:hypothetical protein
VAVKVPAIIATALLLVVTAVATMLTATVTFVLPAAVPAT